MRSELYLTKDNTGNKAEEWLSIIDRKRKWKSAPKKTLLLVLDMQRFFLEPESHAYVPSGRAMIPRLREFIGGFHGPVIFTKHVKGSSGNLMREWWRDIPEGELSEIVPELAPLAETIIEKEHYSAFHGTELDSMLSSQGIDSVLISGVLTDLCCESTARGAFMRGYRTYFIADLTATATEERHISTLKVISNAFGEVIPSKVIK
ncbi:MAG: isochorismatase family cysteine hydrolase [Thermoplasmatota archaeon]